MLLLTVIATFAANDIRNVVTSGVPLSFNRSQYYNQPQAVQLSNGSWLVVMTNAPYTEGDPRQRVESTLHPSPDLTEPTWLPPVLIEAQPYGPSAGWVVPLYAPRLRRLYAFYTYNYQNITTVPPSRWSNQTRPCRCNLVGGQWFRYSDDDGATWSRHRYQVSRHKRISAHCRWGLASLSVCIPIHHPQIPIRKTSIDTQNDWNGTSIQGRTLTRTLMRTLSALA